jgi:hypothetical protein
MDAMAALRIALVFAVLPLGGCASTAEIYTQQDPSADFSSYRTFTFESRLGTDRADGGRHYDVWDGYATQTTQYTEGTLYVELAEERRDQLVWEGVAQGRIGKKELQDGRAALTAAVAEIFASYPYHRAN